MLRTFRIFFLLLVVIFFLGCATAPYQPALIPYEGIYHIVGSGQNLYRISKAYGVDVNEIMRLNNINNPDQIGVGDRLFIPRAEKMLSIEPYHPAILDSAEKMVGKKQHKVKWRYITLHHSATREGNAEAFDRDHRRRKMGGLFYHFVIGNGTGSGDGEVEVGWRWRKQIEVERKKDIQVCLVGDFNRQDVSSSQYNSLIKLLRVLNRQYSVQPYNIRRHKDIGGKITECPGESFPFYKILAELRKNG